MSKQITLGDHWRAKRILDTAIDSMRALDDLATEFEIDPKTYEQAGFEDAFGSIASVRATFALEMRRDFQELEDQFYPIGATAGRQAA